MNKYGVRVVLIAVAVIAGLGIVWNIRGALQRHRGNILQVPIDLGDGASFSREFTVDLESEYWLAIRLPTTIRIHPRDPVPVDDFFVEFTIRAGTKAIVDGNNAAEPRAAIASKESTTRILARFRAEPRIRYKLTFRVNRVGPESARVKSAVLIFLDPHLK